MNREDLIKSFYSRANSLKGEFNNVTEFNSKNKTVFYDPVSASDYFKRILKAHHTTIISNDLSKVNNWVVSKRIEFQKFRYENLENPNISDSVKNYLRELFALLFEFLNKLEDILKKEFDELFEIETAVKEEVISRKEDCVSREVIEDKFYFLSEINPKKRIRRLSEDDFNIFVDAVYHYYNNDYEIPKNVKGLNPAEDKTILRFSLKVFHETIKGKPYPPNLSELYTTLFPKFKNDNPKNFEKQHTIPRVFELMR